MNSRQAGQQTKEQIKHSTHGAEAAQERPEQGISATEQIVPLILLTFGAMEAAILSYSEVSARISSSCSCSQGIGGGGGGGGGGPSCARFEAAPRHLLRWHISRCPAHPLLPAAASNCAACLPSADAHAPRIPTQSEAKDSTSSYPLLQRELCQHVLRLLVVVGADVDHAALLVKRLRNSCKEWHTMGRAATAVNITIHAAQPTLMQRGSKVCQAQHIPSPALPPTCVPEAMNTRR